MHWCADETQMVFRAIGAIPFIGMFIRHAVIRWKMRRKQDKECHPHSQCV